ncbi:LANO_0B05248g1_1 [Lachancea nothofagi CBS 11611]|uniref:Helicase SWR1 n=1 Tax=Lachancea nothofagi CBS 11611 TaxID=1266666 RepID=A0A1G4IY70_9SACH|nr:LANO_0B05248g1_1 [Lachancea nothofagi CBS 11611]
MTSTDDTDEQIAELKFNYDVLINELYHLKEYTSLVEFDPCLRNSSESFEHFVKSGNLDISKANSNDEDDANASRRVRRRQARGEVSIPTDSGLGPDVEFLVGERYNELECRMEQKPYKRQKLVKNEPFVKKQKVEVKSQPTGRISVKEEENNLTGGPINTVSTLSKLNGIDDRACDSTYYTSSSSDEEWDSKRKSKRSPRIRITVDAPKQTVTNPLHVLKPEFKSLNEFLKSYKALDEDMSINEYNRYVQDQKSLFSKISKGLETGVLHYDYETDSIQAITLKDATATQSHRPEPIKYLYKEQQQYTFRDHLVNQGIFMSRLFQETKKARASNVRKITQMVEQHFRHVAGAEDRKQKEEDKRLKTLARTAVQAVKRRWMVAEKAYKVLKKDEEDQLKKIQGKEHLSKMLEQSTQLLGAQLKHFTNDDDDKGVNTSASHSDMEHSNNDSDSASFTSSDDADSWNDSEDDARLSVEQLQAKYASLKSEKDEAAEVHESETVLSGEEDEPVKDDGSNTALLSEEDEHVKVDESNKLLSSEEKEHVKADEFEAVLSDEEDNESPSPALKLTEKEKIEWQKNQDDEKLAVLDDETSDASESDAEQSSFLNSDGENEEEDNTGIKEDQPEGLMSLFEEIAEDQSEDESDYASSSANDIALSEEQESSDSEMDEAITPEPAFDKKSQIEVHGGSKEEIEKDPLAVVDVPIPSLLRGSLRIYQKQGLNWLASLYNNKTNGILADEMGLGKTIQTISLLAYLACEKENWGPHLIVVPTSVLLNWEMELKRFAPGFKVMTYYGSPQQRKEKRKGWNRPDAFHICITSYQLVVHDQHSFKRKKWQYMILDEAHNIKNFRSTRWQALLNFNTERRLLLTGTPLQNNLAELWSLLYFLMPQTAVGNNGGIQGFADLEAFQQWFGRPVDKIIQTGEGYQQDSETRKTVDKLHQVLRPYLLRRLKADVEKQMPAKHEHVVYCRLSKRQRFLYDDFMSRAQTKETLSSGNFMSIINCLMQLRKVCNHPDLFEVRPILTSLCLEMSVPHDYVTVSNFITKKLHSKDSETLIDLNTLNLKFSSNDSVLSSHHAKSIEGSQCIRQFTEEVSKLRKKSQEQDTLDAGESLFNFQDINQFYQSFAAKKTGDMVSRLQYLQYVNDLRCAKKPVYGSNLLKLLSVTEPCLEDSVEELYRPLQSKILDNNAIIEKFAVITPKVVTLDARDLTLGLNEDSIFHSSAKSTMRQELRHTRNPLHKLQTKLAIAFPDKSLLQYDCGKLQKLATLLRDLKDGGHRALIFTQMTKVLDILEQFLNYHGYLYMRLDGATKIEDRQILTERFNTDNRITAFILSSRSGGLGINLTGADTVIFYDSDWNPAMDKQCQDRCHRIGQTRDVHIYRFVSDHTIESNILKKANQKRHLDNLVIQRGDFTTDYFTKLSVKDLVGAEMNEVAVSDKPLLMDEDAATKDPRKLEKLLAQAEDADDVKAAKLAMREVEVDNEDFQEMKSRAEEDGGDGLEDEYEGTNHVEEYMIRFIANGCYYD